jgi:hypothetical protein
VDIVDIGIESDLAKFREGALAWLAEWDSDRVLGHFNEVPEESLNTVIWKSVTRASRTLGASTSLLRKYLDGQSTVEECLGRIAETFQDEPERFDRAKTDLETVRIYLESLADRGRIERYVLTAATTNEPAVESARAEVFAALTEYGASPDSERTRQIGYAFSKFQAAYIPHYVDGHDSVMRSHGLQEQAAQLLESDDWWFYRNVADLVPSDAWSSNVSELASNLKRLDCSAKTQDLLQVEARCSCGFEITSRQKWESIVNDLDTAFHVATDEFLEALKDALMPVADDLERLANSADEDVLKKSLVEVERFVCSGTRPEKWTGDHARAFRLAHACVKRTPGSTESGDERLLTEADIESAVLSLA